jgi:hypothetical protein
MSLNPQSRKANLVVQQMEDEVLIYDLTSNKAFCLNKTSALVWQACDGKRTTTEIAELIGKQLKTPANEDLIWLTLDLLKKEKLIESEGVLEHRFAGMSRRQVIKKVGLGTMATLPIVAAVVAPTAVTAQSCGGATGLTIGMACNQDCQCMSNCCGVIMTCGVSGVAMNLPCLVDCNCSSGSCANVMVGMITLMLCA